MKNTDENPLVSIEPLIHLIRNQQVILDSDLAMLYGVETKRLNEQVKRNADRFPEDFMFQLTKEEAEQSRSRFATLNTRGSNIKYLPYVFTENGVAMLSSVLRSPIAIQVNIRIMRTFTNMRKVMGNAMQVMERLTRMEYRQVETDKRLDEVFRILGGKDGKAAFKDVIPPFPNPRNALHKTWIYLRKNAGTMNHESCKVAGCGLRKVAPFRGMVAPFENATATRNLF